MYINSWVILSAVILIIFLLYRMYQLERLRKELAKIGKAQNDFTFVDLPRHIGYLIIAAKHGTNKHLNDLVVEEARCLSEITEKAQLVEYRNDGDKKLNRKHYARIIAQTIIEDEKGSKHYKKPALGLDGVYIVEKGK